MRIISFLIFFVAIRAVWAQPCLFLAYEPFSYTSSQPLHQLGGGAGWLAPWDVQGGNTAVPGYGILEGSLEFGALQTQDGQVGGGYGYLTAGRRFDLSAGGPFTSYLSGGGGVGSSRTGTIYVSGLMRKLKDNQESLFYSLHGDNIPWYVNNPGTHLEVGYFGASSETNGVKYWSIRLSGVVIQTAIPVEINEDVFLVVQFVFSSVGTTVNYWVNPATIGNASAPAPTFSQFLNAYYSIKSLGLYLGSSVENGRADEVRVATSYACVSPDVNTVVNQPPVAVLSASATEGVAPFTIQFNGASSFDPEGGALTYHWDFGDGSDQETGLVVDHTYSAIGILQPQLTVTDPFGLQQKAYHQLKVLDEYGVFPCQSKFTVLSMSDCGLATGHVKASVGVGVGVEVYSSSGALLTATAGLEYKDLSPGIYQFIAAGDNGCRDTFDWHIEIDSTACVSWAASECAMDIGTNMGGLADWSFERPFKNLMKHVRSRAIPFTSDCFCWGVDSLLSEMVFDQSGYPSGIPQVTSAGESYLRYVLSSGGGNLRPGYSYLLLYEGQGELQLQGSVSIISSAGGRIEFSVTAPENIWFNLNYSYEFDPVRNIRLVRVEDELADLVTNPFYDGFLEKVLPFKMLRFMDWGATNNNGIVRWEDRKDTSWFTYSTTTGVPYEMMIRLANQIKKDVWVCVPHAADTNFIQQMAHLFKEALDPSLTIYLEYSNEVWNWIFAQAAFNDQNRPSNLNYARAYAEKASRVFKLWQEEFGEDRGRVKRVLGIQTLYNSLNEEILGQLKQEDWDIGAATHYIALNHSSAGNPVLHSASTSSDILENAKNEWLSVRGNLQRDFYQVKLFGKEVVTYEGGQHFVGNVFGIPYGYQQAMWDAQYSPGMYNLYDMVLDSIRNWGCSLAGNFSLAGKQESVYGSWGALSDIDQQPPYFSIAPKYQALIDNISDVSTPVAFFGVEVNGLMVFFENQSSGAENYWWDFGDGTFSNLEHPVHSYSDTGLYSIKLIVQNECGISEYVDAIYLQTTRLGDVHLEACGILYPNPNNGQFRLILNRHEAKELQILNMLGEVVYSAQAMVDPVTDLSVHLPAGAYILVWRSDQISGQAQFIVR